MFDAYKTMINDPDFADGEGLVEILAGRVEASENWEETFANQDDLYVVQGLALIYGGLLRTRIDIPGFGRTTLSNPAPPAVYKEATVGGYRESPMALDTNEIDTSRLIT